ncbi:MAG: trigger factor [Ignavibacteria bacterium]|nr:trigger factor [Ignavibacteria bacterium]
METKLNPLHESESELEVTLAPEEIADDIEKAYQKELKKVNVPGFRKGKVPRSIVEKMYGSALQYDAAESVANQHFFNYIEENKINVYDRPRMTDFKYEPGQPLSFKVVFEHTPKIELKQYKNIEVEVTDLKVTDEMVDGEIKKMLDSKATLTEAEVIDGDNYVVDCELSRSNESVHHPEEGGNKPFPLTVKLYQEGVQESIKNALAGKKVGEDFDFSFEDSHSHSHEDGTTEEHKETFSYKGKVLSIKKAEFPETTDEFVKEITHDRAQNIDELKKQIKDDYETYYAEKMDEETEYKLEDKLIELNPYTPPATFLKRYHENLIEDRAKELKKQGKQYPREYLEKTLAPAAERFVKLYFIRKEIIAAENITVTEEAVREFAEVSAKKMNLPADALFSFYNESEDGKETILRQEYLKYLKAQNTIKKVDLPDKKEA